MKKIIFVILLMVTFSCTKTKSITLETENAEGISNETKLKISGIEIGEIENIKLNETGKVQIVAKLNSELNIPIDSDFEIKNEGLIGGKIINITIGKSIQNFTEKSIVKLKTESGTFTNDSIGFKIEKAIQEISGKEKNDSILKELKRLNENLEKKK